MVSRIRIGLDEVMVHFSELEDPRSEVNLRHPLESVVVIALMAVLAGASGPTSIARWALIKAELLTTLLPLPNGVPRKDVFRRVLSALQPETFQVCFVNWLQALRAAAAATGIDQPVFAVDGKTLRRSHDKSKGLGALHSVSVWASDFGLSLGQVATDQKSNALFPNGKGTAIPELLKLVDLRGAIITIDARGTQKAIAKAIVDGGADYCPGVEGQPRDTPRRGHCLRGRTDADRLREHRCPSSPHEREGSRSRRDPAPTCKCRRRKLCRGSISGRAC